MKRWAMGLLILLGMSFGLVCLGADFNGDGTGDIAIFRSGLWAVRDITRVYLGVSSDDLVPGDYNGSGIDRPAIFRSSTGLWAVRDLTRIYFGGSTDEPKTGDYNGDGIEDFGIFRPNSGLWAVSGITRVYFGSSTDVGISPGKARTRGLLKTGQTAVYHAGDDGTYQKGMAFNYQTSNPAGNGEIVTTDNVTGLMWASDGNGAGCFNGGTRTWTESLDWAEGLTFAGYSDWRLPNRRELESLINAGRANPAINTTYFPNTSADYYWSGSTYADLTVGAWVVGFDVSGVGAYDKTDTYYVRAVRGGE